MSETANTPTPPFGEDPKATAKAAKAYAKASRKWYQKKRWWAVIAIVVLGVIGAASGSGGGDKNEPAANDNTGAITAPASPTTASANPTPSRESKPTPKSTVGQVLLNIHGTGMTNTQKFTAKGDWDLGYKFDCANFGQSGIFQVYVYDAKGSLVGVAANSPGVKGADVDHEHRGGTFYLQVNSVCDWSMKVTSAS